MRTPRPVHSRPRSPLPTHVFQTHTLRAHKARVNTLVDLKTKIISGSVDRQMCVWDTASLRLLKQVTGHSGYIATALGVFKRDCWRVWSAGNEGVLRLWDLDGQCETVAPSLDDHLFSRVEAMSDMMEIDMVAMESKILALGERIQGTEEELGAKDTDISGLRAHIQLQNANVLALQEEVSPPPLHFLSALKSFWEHLIFGNSLVS